MRGRKERAIEGCRAGQLLRRSLKWSNAGIVLAALAGTVALYAVIDWVAGLHGVGGLDRWFLPFSTFLLFLRVLALILLPLAAACVALREYRPTHRRPLWLRALLFALACLLAAGLVLPVGLYAGIRACGSYDAGDKPPLLLLSDSTGRYGVPDLCLSFWTEEETANALSWGPEGGENRVEEPVPSRTHAFMLADLEPGREYRYSLNGGEAVTFRTPSTAPDTLSFAVGSDPHFGGKSNTIY